MLTPETRNAILEIRDSENLWGFELISAAKERGLIGESGYRKLRQMLVFNGCQPGEKPEGVS